MNNNFFSLQGKAAIITGGGTGIGKGCARILAQAGAKVLVVGRRLEQLQETKNEIEKDGGVCECFTADLMVEDNCKAMVKSAVMDNAFLGLSSLISGDRKV